MKVLPFSVLAASGESFQVMFPLHPQTASPDLVGMLTSRLLDTISATLRDHPGSSSGDVLQAVAMALAVRAQVVDAPPQAAARVAEGLLADALGAVAESRRMSAGRA